jgi:hypothetical protein
MDCKLVEIQLINQMEFAVWRDEDNPLVASSCRPKHYKSNIANPFQVVSLAVN